MGSPLQGPSSFEAAKSPVDGLRQTNYRPILEIGHGGMSRVYLALVRGPGDFNKLQVVKRLLPTLASDPEFLEMFLEEARLSARLNHSNIVQINEVAFDGTHHYMAMEYLEGQSLDSIVRATSRNGGIPVAMHLRVIADACAGLHYAHDLTDIDGRPLNIVHRDVSPHNIFVTYAGQVKVLDFGIAKAADSSHHTRTGVVKGKCAYMAPEQFRNEPIDRRADIFALGVMVWQAATNRRLWKGLTDIEIFHRLATSAIPSPLSVDPNVPPGLVAICERALAPKLEHRYGTAAELGEAIENYLATLPEAPAARDIGRFVADTFTETRERVRAAVEAELHRSESEAMHTTDVPIFVDTGLPNDEDGYDANSMRAPPPAAGAAPFAGHMPFAGGHSVAPTQMSETVDPAMWPGQQVHAPPTAPSGSLRALKIFVVGGLALVAVVGGVLLVLTLRNPSTNEAPRLAEGTPAGETAGPVDDKYTSLRVEATPRSARIYVDEVLLSENPGTGRFLRDGALHRVRAEAPGFKGKADTMMYDRAEKSVTLTLEPEARSAHSDAVPSRGGSHGPQRVKDPTTPSSHDTPPVVSTPPVVTPPPPAPTSKKPTLDRNVFDP
jgi:serine/threonine protein kinase